MWLAAIAVIVVVFNLSGYHYRVSKSFTQVSSAVYWHPIITFHLNDTQDIDCGLYFFLCQALLDGIENVMNLKLCHDCWYSIHRRHANGTLTNVVSGLNVTPIPNRITLSSKRSFTTLNWYRYSSACLAVTCNDVILSPDSVLHWLTFNYIVMLVKCKINYSHSTRRQLQSVSICSAINKIYTKNLFIEKLRHCSQSSIILGHFFIFILERKLIN